MFFLFETNRSGIFSPEASGAIPAGWHYLFFRKKKKRIVANPEASGGLVEKGRRIFGKLGTNIVEKRLPNKKGR